MSFSTIISTIDSQKSLCGSTDDFTTAKLSARFLLLNFTEDMLFLAWAGTTWILGELPRTLIPGFLILAGLVFCVCSWELEVDEALDLGLGLGLGLGLVKDAFVRTGGTGRIGRGVVLVEVLWSWLMSNIMSVVEEVSLQSKEAKASSSLSDSDDEWDGWWWCWRRL